MEQLQNVSDFKDSKANFNMEAKKGSGVGLNENYSLRQN